MFSSLRTLTVSAIAEHLQYFPILTLYAFLLEWLADRALEALSGGSKSSAALLFQRSVEAALHNGECYLAYYGDVICGVAAWLAPGSEWRFLWVSSPS